MICDGTCANPLTDEQNCGGCGTTCSATEACVSGTCMAANIHCQRVREADADAPDGTYVNPATNDAFYCDFANSVTYDEVIMAPYTSMQTDYTLLTGTELAADTTLQKAFVGLFNAAGGVRSAGTYSFPNCCIYVAANTALLFEGMPLTPIREGSYTCEAAGENKIYNFSLDGSAMTMRVEPPLADSYFTNHAVSQGAACGENGNPGLFYKKHAGLM